MLTQPAKFHVAELCSQSTWMGACHGDELFFLFLIPRQTLFQDQQLSHDMISAWTNFAKQADPGIFQQVTSWEQALPRLADSNGGADSGTNHLSIAYSSSMNYEYYRKTCNQFWSDKIFV